LTVDLNPQRQDRKPMYQKTWDPAENGAPF